ncbi:MAG: hypothetical protein IIA61_08755 [Candidatus Marinimicrobia bacterium]|nr:hypothetical protein [Candidatus Neomarinimicrobiota bacterium]
MKSIAILLGTVAVITLISLSCENEDCSDCGGTIAQGFIFRMVTAEDLTTLGDIPDIELEACMRFKLIGGTEIEETTVKIVDDCCCD